ncbi:conserved membrane protein of unknown function [Bradyrhizobium sp. ORS 285]|uniref:hypothetical protein n=1 Tax=Bradyrhizobium sp. ORS 285 TaxID=115808 RepID=UPI0002408A7B|nr:hypothetical protein [Bradyrhizobium sp. ORS 285]CCD89758.1 conserved membrane hypothetical protein [Bradyrhizobium sp. ORS 285]SMX61804.1 conserved membrane protein of unknown function [Bradyrhizobium sp. ORS 285]
MAEESVVASIIPWREPKTAKPRPKRPKVVKPRPRAKGDKADKSEKIKAALDDEMLASETLIMPDFLELVNEPAKAPMKTPAAAETSRTEAAASAASAAITSPVPPATVVPATVTREAAQPLDGEIVAPSAPVAPAKVEGPRLTVSSVLLQLAALALAAVGMAMNGWFAHSLGSNSTAGWMFLAIGVTADLVALVMPTCAARLWHARHRASALAGWIVWVMTFVFALTAGIGFASTNISDVTLARASRVTPAVQAAQTALGDAMAARDRECKGGVGKFCREREAAVAERRQALDTAMAAVSKTADPQTEAAIKLVAWITQGRLAPSADDFAMLRLILLALLPQLGGILLMVGRRV